ncbi:Gas2-Like Protein 3 [Manis pentadactyla]|nr:Gas2-Like Protein 3 [Manis pentadactyla]
MDMVRMYLGGQSLLCQGVECKDCDDRRAGGFSKHFRNEKPDSPAAGDHPRAAASSGLWRGVFGLGRVYGAPRVDGRNPVRLRSWLEAS